MIIKYLCFVFLISLSVFLYSCGDIIGYGQSKPDVPLDHDRVISGVFHKSGERGAEGCSDCHGEDLRGGIRTLNGRYIFAQSCYQCHGNIWERNGNGNGINNY